MSWALIIYDKIMHKGVCQNWLADLLGNFRNHNCLLITEMLVNCMNIFQVKSVYKDNIYKNKCTVVMFHRF